MDQKKIGSFLKELRNEKGITQEYIAEMFGVSQRTVSRWETGKNMPDISMLISLAEVYEVDICEIINGERKCEMINNEVKDTLEKVVDYNNVASIKAMNDGIKILLILTMLLTTISFIKGITSAPLLSLILAYNGTVYLSQSKITKVKRIKIIGIIYLIAMVIAIIFFIIMPPIF